jgi:hypothetical protein
LPPFGGLGGGVTGGTADGTYYTSSSAQLESIDITAATPGAPSAPAAPGAPGFLMSPDMFNPPLSSLESEAGGILQLSVPTLEPTTTTPTAIPTEPRAGVLQVYVNSLASLYASPRCTRLDPCTMLATTHSNQHIPYPLHCTSFFRSSLSPRRVELCTELPRSPERTFPAHLNGPSPLT